MMQVELINKEEVKNLFKNWGYLACECYATPKQHAEKVGKHCLNSHHFSGSRCEYFKFEIKGISRACSLQLNRHSIGVVLQQQSQRYVNMDNAEFVVPHRVRTNPYALSLYENLIEASKETYKLIQEELIASGCTKEQANEEARYGLLESCETSGTWSFTLEALIHFMHKRTCRRSQDEIRQLANEMRKAVLEVLPELKEYLVPHCVELLYCPESKSCGIYPTKEEVKGILKQNRNNDGF